MHYGGELKSHKGMNLPGIEVSAPALTEKDLEDVAQAAAVGVDYMALSFVRRPEDIEQLRALVPRSTKLIAKIEKDTALRNLCGILDVVRRHHGGAGRPRRGAAVRGGAADAEADHPGSRPPRETGDHRHADARVDGPRPSPHPGRGLRCRQRDPRRHRRRDALGRDRGRRVSARGGAGHGSHRARDGDAAAESRRGDRRRARAPLERRRGPASSTARRRAGRSAPRTPSRSPCAPRRKC